MSPSSTRPRAEECSTEALERLRSIGKRLLSQPAPPTPEAIVMAVQATLGCSWVALWEQRPTQRRLAVAGAFEPPIAIDLDLALDHAGTLRLHLGLSSSAHLDKIRTTLDALAPWLALALRTPTIPPSLEQRLDRIAAQWNLSPAQRGVLRGIVQGKSNKELAAESDRHLKTIESHVTAVLRRSGIDSRKELLSYLLAGLDREPGS